jgi:hypothetical protein
MVVSSVGHLAYSTIQVQVGNDVTLRQVTAKSDPPVFDCTSQEKAAHGHVLWVVQEMPKTASKGAQNSSQGPGNERCRVKSNVASLKEVT